MRATRLSARRNPVAWLRAGVFVALIAAGLLLTTSSSGAASNTITQPDIGGQFTSLKLDSSGNPVISHYDPMTHDLKVVHCGNATCSTGNAITAPDPTGLDDQMYPVTTSLVLAAGDVPVVSYLDALSTTQANMKLVHCGNPACTTPTIRTLDSSWPPTHQVGLWNSLALNTAGNPVVSYYMQPHDILKALFCNDATCSSYGLQNVDSLAITGLYASMVLDASGFPVISYYDQTAGDLKVAHCGNASCSSSTITTVDGAAPAAQVGKYTSLALDASGFPVVSYYNETNGDLKVVHCGDANCSSGNTIATPDAGGTVGQHTSLALDAAGNPVVSYYNVGGSALKVLHCGDATCTAGNTITMPDAAGIVGQYTSLALDGAGNAVVSYYDATDGKLNVLRCGDASCAGEAVAVGGLTELANVQARSGGGRSVAVWISALVVVAAVFLAAGVARRLKAGSE